MKQLQPSVELTIITYHQYLYKAALGPILVGRGDYNSPVWSGTASGEEINGSSFSKVGVDNSGFH